MANQLEILRKLMINEPKLVPYQPKEHDPNGLSQHSPGAKLDAGKPRMGLVLKDFARALTSVSEVGTFGANKYTAHGWLEVPNGIERYSDAMIRHFFKEETEGLIDADSGCLHAAQVAWCALARLELMLLELEKQSQSAA